MIQTEKKIWFRDICIKNGLLPTDEQIEQLSYYVTLLLEWNKKINIISRKDEENIWTYHILHSVSPLFKIEINQNSTMVDIGTGGGLPGVPMKIMRPDLTMLCIDSTGKKIKALSQMIHDIKLNQINSVWGRAEEIGLKSEYSGKFDFAVARAVAPLHEILYWAKPFLKKSETNKNVEKIFINSRIDPKPPVLLAFKGGDVSQELEIAKRKQTQINVQSIDLTLKESEQLIDSDKKILIVHW